MPDDDKNLELLALVHSLQVSSQKAQEILGHAIAISSNAGFFPMTLQTATMTQHLLAVQSKLITKLLEENQEIRDQVTSLVERLEQS